MRPVRPGAWVAAWALASAPAIAWVTASGDPFHVAGVVAGVLGTTWLAVSLCLMVRLQPLERAFGGLNQLYYAHHVTGALAYLFLLAHPLLLALSQYRRSPATTTSLLVPAAGDAAMLSGWAALLILMAMMVTMFLLPMRYVQWKRLHAVSVAAYALGALHVAYLMPGGMEHRSGPVVVATWLLLGAAAASYRYLLDNTRVAARTFQVESVRPLDARTVEVTLAPLGRPLAFRAGQFVLAAFYDGNGYQGCREYHPYTISSSPSGKELGMIIKALGDCTTQLQRIRPGVAVAIQGPFGAFFETADANRPQVWIAGGIGITPFLAQATARGAGAPPADLHYSTRGQQDALCLPELRALGAEQSGLRIFHIHAEDDAAPVWDSIRFHSAPFEGKAFFLCGPPAFVAHIQGRLVAAGVPVRNIHSERFDFL
jgi:predicted ferric reductase